MKIDFSLTEDQFNKAQTLPYDRPKTGSFASLLILFTSAVMVLVGYAVAQHTNQALSVIRQPSCSLEIISAAGAIALFIGMLFPCIAVLVVVVRQRWIKRQAQRQLAGMFKRFYSGPRCFQTSDSSWQFEFSEMQHTKAWSRLARIIKSDELFIMQDAYSSYTIPRTAMTPEQYKELSDLCEHALTPKESFFTVSLNATAMDYVTSMMRADWWHRPWGMSALMVLGLLVLRLFTFVIVDAWPMLGNWIFFPLILLVPLLHGLSHYQTFQANRGRSYLSGYVAQIANDRIHLSAGDLYAAGEIRVFLYRWIETVRESRRMMFLYVDSQRAFAIPKSAFEPNQLMKFRQLLKSQND